MILTKKKIGLWHFFLEFILIISIISSKKICAASVSELNSETMFIKQNTKSTCTLSSSAMMLRRYVFLSGNGNWEEITENNLRSTAWVEGSGLRNSFSYAGVQVSGIKISSNRTQTMINLLEQHPEGIVIYDFEQPHAILLTDYTDGIFYCADPSSIAQCGRIPVSQATVTIENMDKYWYISGSKLEIDSDEPMVTEGCYFDKTSGKLTITEDFNWFERNLNWIEDWIEGLNPEEVIIADIDLSGTKILLKNEESECHICLNNFTNLETVSFKGSVDERLEIYLNEMFKGCSKLKNIDFSGFSDVNVMDMQRMFDGCSSLANLDLSSLDTSNVTTMHSMFNDCSSLTNLDLSNFDTSNVSSMNFMFENCSSLINLNLNNFDTSNVTGMSSMFFGCSSLTSLNLRNFNTSNVKDPTLADGSTFLTGMSMMFAGCNSLTNLDLSSFDTSNIKVMSSMFSGCSSLKSLDLSSFDTSNVIGMESMFRWCHSLTDLDLHNFDISNVKYMESMFHDCSSLESLDLSNFSNSNVTAMSEMFKNCTSLKSIDLHGFDTSNVTTMSCMFDGCNSLTNLDLGNFNTSNVTAMNEMFNNCTLLKSIDLHGFNTSNVTTMYYMFRNCNSLKSLNLSNFDTSNIKNMIGMFWGCNSLKEIDISSFDFNKTESNDGYWIFGRMDSVEKIKIPKNLPYGIHFPGSLKIPSNMESYWIDAYGNEYKEIQANVSVPMTYYRRLRTVVSALAMPMVKGEKFTDIKKNFIFKVISSNSKKPTVAFIGVTKKSKKVIIPPTVTYQRVTYQVTSVSVKALKGNTKIKSLVIGSNVTKIEKNAFEGCRNLKKITIKSNYLNSVGKNALKGIHKKCKIKVPSSKLKKYRKLFWKKGQKPTIKII